MLLTMFVLYEEQLTGYTKIILSVNEKLPDRNLDISDIYLIQLFGYCYVHVSGHRQAGLER